MGNLENEYPHLFCEVLWEWGSIRAEFKKLDSEPPHHLIANVNLIPRVGDDWVLLQHENGDWDFPGGTLEPGETYLDTLHRELLEEAGATLRSFQILGAWHCISLAEKPYRNLVIEQMFYGSLSMYAPCRILRKKTLPLRFLRFECKRAAPQRHP